MPPLRRGVPESAQSAVTGKERRAGAEEEPESTEAQEELRRRREEPFPAPEPEPGTAGAELGGPPLRREE
jgi:hypothetical protein